MNRALSIFILLCAFAVRGADLTISNNAIICWFSDSLSSDTSGDPPTTGFMSEAYVHSYFALNYPQYTLFFYNISRSGGTMDDVLTNRLQETGLGVWGYRTNNDQHIGIITATDNGALSSNAMYLDLSNCFQAPALMSDGDSTLVSHTGWCSGNSIEWIGLGDPPAPGSDGGFATEFPRDTATTNAGWTLGVRGIDAFNLLSNSFSRDWANTSWTNVGFRKSGHLGPGGQLAWAFAFIKGITTDTNISNCTVDWNAAAVLNTNHCVVSSVSRTENVLTFTRHDDRLPMAWDFPGIDSLGFNITNDCSPDYTVLNPGDANLFQFSLQITNLPPGNYTVRIDGQFVATLPSSTLATGWNMFTNTVGPYWNQRLEVLGRIRDLEYVSRDGLIPGSAGNGVGLVSLGSTAFSKWGAGYRGDELIAQLDSKVTQVQTNFAAINSAAQPTNHTFQISQNLPLFAPFHR